MTGALMFVGWAFVVMAVAVAWRTVSLQQRTRQRWLGQRTRPASPEERRFMRRLTRRWLWAPYAVAVLVTALVWLTLGLSPPYLLAIAVLTALIGTQIESFFAMRIVSRMETQLADAIDIMIGAVSAGSSVNAAIDAAIIETAAPLKGYLEELAGRIRLGDDPTTVFRAFADQVPLETFLLFASTLSVHWEVGGRLAPTLATVGRTIRDRNEVSLRIRANIAQSQYSTLALLALTYFIAAIVWRSGPDQMYDFVNSSIGSWFVAASVILQGLGIYWMDWISKPKF